MVSSRETPTPRLVFATQQAYHITTAQALTRLGMDATSWLWQRAAISVLLVCLSGYLRYRAPRKDARSLEERKRAIQEQMELEALKAQQRARKVAGAVGLVRGAAQAARGQSDQHDRSDRHEPRATTERPGVGGRAEVSAEVAPPLPMHWPRLPTTPSNAASNGHT